jgi:NAD(P)-dependent dehydrogenase (short-subunit alcohol dehydrogenase family)
MDLTGKTAVVTGGTSGIGRAVALLLANRGAEVMVIGRDRARGAETEAALRRASGGTGAFLRADLSLLSSTRGVVAELLGRARPIDALVQCAGVVGFERSITPEGLDGMFVTNFLHKVVVAEGLEPLLARGPGRMVFVAADWWGVGIDWANFEGQRVYSGVRALPRLNAATLAVAQRLAAEWKARGIEVTAIHPGQVETGLFRSFRGVWKLGRALMSPFIVPVERPARLVTWLAFSPEARGLSGCFFPSVKDYARRRLLDADAATVERMWRVAREALITT